MTALLCDAMTAAGKPCKNRSIGTTASGRNYCYLKSHQRQVEAAAPVAEPEPAVVEEEEVGEEIVEDVVLEPEVEEKVEAMIEQAEVELAEEVASEPEVPVVPSEIERIIAANPCPKCGSLHLRFLSYKVSDAPGTRLMCRACGHRWVL